MPVNIVSNFEEAGVADSHQAKMERRIAFTGLFFLTVLASIDVVEDFWEKEPVVYPLFEAAFFILVFLGLSFLWKKACRLKRETSDLHSTIHLLHKDREFWKYTASSYLRGLGAAIDQQFTLWKLTEAEKAVGLLLLKGFSHKEIGQLRATSDSTIKQQAASIYRKARLDGRAQLAAFFLEDLLLPSELSADGTVP